MYNEFARGIFEAIKNMAIKNELVQNEAIEKMNLAIPKKKMMISENYIVEAKTVNFVREMVIEFLPFVDICNFMAGYALLWTLKNKAWLSNSDEEEVVFQKYANLIETKVATIDENDMITY